MKLLYLKLYILIIILAGITISYSCKKTGEDTSSPPVNTVTASVSGLVTDINNVPVSNAAVTSGTATTTTDANGKFMLTKVQFTSDSVLVNVTKSSFFEGSKKFASTNSSVTNAIIKLIPKTVSGSFSAASGGNVNVSNGGSINFNDGFINVSSGNVYSGSVSVSATYLNPTDQNFNLNVPGNIKGVSNTNQPGVLQSFGVMAVELNDGSGNKLQLAQGKTATITLPIPAALLNKAPSSIQLWYFENTSGLWKQEGSAAKQGNNYVGVVNHFSFWSVGDIAGSISLTASFTDSINGTPFANKQVTIIRLDSTSGGTGATNGRTNNSGTVSGLVPVNEALIMRVYGDCGAILYSKNIGPFGKDTVLASTAIKNSCPDTTQSNVDVYVGGYEYNAAGISAAKYWRNGLTIPITFGTINSFANSIAVVGSNVYATVNIEGSGGGWWSTTTSGTGIFGGSSSNSRANSIAVAGSAVYVVGYDYNGPVTFARYWGPGQWFSLTDSTKNAKATCVTVSGSDVYVAGYEYNNAGFGVAKYWKNGQAIALSDGTRTTLANSIVVSGSDVYVAGSDSSSSSTGNIAKYWKNGVAIPLTDGTKPSSANSIAVAGSDVYVAGSENNVAKYWKNGQAITLTGGVSASSIAIIDSDVYVSGYGYNGSGSVAKYWKNGAAISLTNGTYNANATSIVVVRR